MTPHNQKFLQLTMSPLEYVTLLKQDPVYGGDEYWARLPTYLIARCPLCKVPYTDKVDAHSLDDWSTVNSRSGTWFFTQKYQQVGCDHRLAVQKFVNLEGNIPSELGGYRADLHVPFITPFFVPADIPSCAVIHSFAICRIENRYGLIYNFENQTFEQPFSSIKQFKEHRRTEKNRQLEIGPNALEDAIFVPRYTGYAITYFAEDCDTIIDRRMKPQFAYYYEKDREYEPVFMASMGEMTLWPHAYDLAFWVELGKLQWLDLESSDLPLKAGPVEDFPYVNIQDDSGGLKPMYF